jgi:hypothetical protein
MTEFATIPDQRSAIQAGCALLWAPGDTVELRAFSDDGRRTVSGYFDDLETFANAALRLNGKLPGIYATLNPVNPALLARAQNHTIERPKSTTSDPDVLRRRRLLIDLDPIRPSGISSSADEHAAAIALADRIAAELAGEFGWPAPDFADSGNGAHLLYPIDLPNDPDSTKLVEGVLKALDFRFSDQAVGVDTKVGNAARITKIYGTKVMKGDDTPDRPHRASGVIRRGDGGMVSREQLEALRAMRPVEAATPGRAGTTTGPWDLAEWISRHGIPVGPRQPWSGGAKYVFERCPWDDNHRGSAYIVHFPSGAVAFGCHHNSCSRYTWTDLREKYEPGAYDRQRERTPAPYQNGHAYSNGGAPNGVARHDGAPAAAPREIEPDWGELRELSDHVIAAPAMPVALVPEPLREWVADISQRMRVPVEMVAIPALVFISSLVGPRLGIYPKKHDDWLVVPNLWGAIVARPGLMKTPVINEALNPLRRLVKRSREDFDRESAESEERRTIIELEIQSLEKRIKTELSKTVPHLSTLQAQLAEKRAEAVSDRPKERRYLTQDATPEKLAEILRDNPGILIQRDELAGFLNGMDRPGHESEREFHLEAWNGGGNFTIDRIGRGTIYVEKLCTSLFGGIQPGRLRKYIAEAESNGTGADGFLQRLQLIVWPDTFPDWQNIDRYPNAEAKNRAFDVFRHIDKIEPAKDFGLERDGDDRIPAIRFNPRAQLVFDSWRNRLELRLRSTEITDVPAFESHLAKYRSLMPSLALLFHLIDGAPDRSVSEVAAELAVEWCTYLEAHAGKIYGSAAARSPGRRLAKGIQAGEISDGMTLREIYFRGWQVLRTPEQVRSAIAELAELRWTRLEHAPPSGSQGGRPSEIIRLHPALCRLARR